MSVSLSVAPITPGGEIFKWNTNRKLICDLTNVNILRFPNENYASSRDTNLMR